MCNCINLGWSILRWKQRGQYCTNEMGVNQSKPTEEEAEAHVLFQDVGVRTCGENSPRRSSFYLRLVRA